jgi:hypothetical protein
VCRSNIRGTPQLENHKIDAAPSPSQVGRKRTRSQTINQHPGRLTRGDGSSIIPPEERQIYHEEETELIHFNFQEDDGVHNHIHEKNTTPSSQEKSIAPFTKPSKRATVVSVETYLARRANTDYRRDDNMTSLMGEFTEQGGQIGLRDQREPSSPRRGKTNPDSNGAADIDHSSNSNTDSQIASEEHSSGDSALDISLTAKEAAVKTLKTRKPLFPCSSSSESLSYEDNESEYECYESEDESKGIIESFYKSVWSMFSPSH